MENCKFNSKITTMPKSKKSLAETHPDLAKEWHPDKNENLTPEGFTAGSKKKVWWKCKTGRMDHVWPATIQKRAKYNKGVLIVH
jgi:hypothetical protein